MIVNGQALAHTQLQMHSHSSTDWKKNKKKNKGVSPAQRYSSSIQMQAIKGRKQ